MSTAVRVAQTAPVGGDLLSPLSPLSHGRAVRDLMPKDCGYVSLVLCF